MISTFLVQAHDAVVPALALVLAACVVVGVLATRIRRPSVVLGPAVAGSALLVAVLCLAPRSSWQVESTCAVQFMMPRLSAVEPLSNIALFVPLVYFLALLVRRPAAALVTGTALSAAIEATQALLPGIGRACDTNDWLMNTTGALVGAGLAGLVLLLPGRVTRPRRAPSA